MGMGEHMISNNRNTEQEKRSHQKKYLLRVLPIIQEKLEEENQKTMAAVIKEAIEYIKVNDASQR